MAIVVHFGLSSSGDAERYTANTTLSGADEVRAVCQVDILPDSVLLRDEPTYFQMLMCEVSDDIIPGSKIQGFVEYVHGD